MFALLKKRSQDSLLIHQEVLYESLLEENTIICMELKQLKNLLMSDMIASGYYARFLEAVNT